MTPTPWLAVASRASQTAILFGAVFVTMSLASTAQQPATDSAALRKRVAALEARQREIEEQLTRMQKQVDDLTSSPPAVYPEIKAPAPIPTKPLIISGLATIGSSSAPLAIIEYSDFQCPFCRRHYFDIWPLIDRDYVQTGKVLYAYHHLPLGTLHPHAIGAAEAAECARRQRRFAEMQERLYSNPNVMGPTTFTEYANAIKLDVPRFEQCLASDAPVIIRGQISDAGGFEIASTPTFLIGHVEANGQVRVVRRISGAQPFAVFKGVLEQLNGKSEQ